MYAASCLFCAILAWKYEFSLEGSEFSAGTVTNPVLEMLNVGAYLFVAALPTIFLCRRQVSGAVTLLASLFCLPFYLYFAIPGPFRWVFKGNYHVPLVTNFVLQKWSMIGIAALAIAAGLGLHGMLRARITLNGHR